MSLARIRALLVDDEVLARLALRQALAGHADVEVVGECGNAAEVLQGIEALAPDLLFLDIQMPGADGFRLLRSLGSRALPMVVFVTAFSQHALRAFDARALDYLLKPIDQERFNQAMTRVRSQWQGLHAAPDSPRVPGGYLQRLSVRNGERIRVIATEQIDWVRADGNYVLIKSGGITYLHRESLRNLIAALDPARFLRIHRAIVVNIERIREVHPLLQGSAEVVLQDGTRLSLSRRFRPQARRALGLP
jgi:two-component system LytT family response regulator